MNTRLLLALCLALGAPLAFLKAADAPAATTGEWRDSLDGPWAFTIDPAQASQPGTAAWDEMTVPGNWDTTATYRTHRGKGWYRRAFTVPAGWSGKQVRLRFDAVFSHAEVTLNGHVLGEHLGGYTPFEFDVTGLLDYDGPNTVTVCADNTARRGAWWPWGGISRDVTLIANNDARIVWQHINAVPNLKDGTATVTVAYKLANTGSTPLPIDLASGISHAFAPAGAANPPDSIQHLAPVPSLRSQITLTPHAETTVTLSVSLPKDDVRLWDFDHPNLYALTTRITSDGKLLHAKTDRFGIRKVEVKADGLYLNGERIRVAGFNRISDSNETGNTEPDALVRRDVDLMKSCGAVFSRLMHTPQAPDLLDYLDDHGLMIYEEIPVWGSGDKNIKAGNPLTEQWLRETIDRDYNHPCIVGWSVGNEITGHYAYVKSMIDYIRAKLDASRLLGYISFTAMRKEYGPSNDPVTFCDIAMINHYEGKGAGFAATAATVRKKWPEKPVFFSEYGSRQIGASDSSRIPGIDSIWAGIEKQPYVIGGSYWSFNDYRSDFKGTPPPGNRTWGVIDIHHNPKAAYWQVRRLYSPVHSLEVKDGVLSLTPRTYAEIPCYTLRGYRVAWTLSDAQGADTSHGVINVPDLAPGSPAWTAPIPGAASAAKVTARLISPTGYCVDNFPAGPIDNLIDSVNGTGML